MRGYTPTYEDEARAFVADLTECYDAAAQLSDSEAREMIERYYPGGWEAFLADTDLPV